MTATPADRRASSGGVPVHELLLGAARSLLRTRAWSEVTMADIARAAGVDEQTAAAAAGSREELAQLFVLHEAERFLAEVEATLQMHAADPVRALCEAAAAFLAAAEQDPLVAAVVAGDPELLRLVTVRGRPVHDRAVGALAALMTHCWSTLPAGRARLVADAFVRLAISHATLPGGPARASSRAIGELLGAEVERGLPGR